MLLSCFLSVASVRTHSTVCGGIATSVDSRIRGGRRGGSDYGNTPIRGCCAAEAVREWLGEAVLGGEAGGGGAGGDAELVVDAAQVLLDGARGEEESPADLRLRSVLARRGGGPRPRGRRGRRDTRRAGTSAMRRAASASARARAGCAPRGVQIARTSSRSVRRCASSPFAASQFRQREQRQRPLVRGGAGVRERERAASDGRRRLEVARIGVQFAEQAMGGEEREGLARLGRMGEGTLGVLARLAPCRPPAGSTAPRALPARTGRAPHPPTPASGRAHPATPWRVRGRPRRVRARRPPAARPRRHRTTRRSPARSRCPRASTSRTAHHARSRSPRSQESRARCWRASPSTRDSRALGAPRRPPAAPPPPTALPARAAAARRSRGGMPAGSAPLARALSASARSSSRRRPAMSSVR